MTEQGIDASRISVATSTTDGQTVENYLVPAGATFSTDVHGNHPGGRDGGEAGGAQAAAGEAHREEEVSGAVIHASADCKPMSLRTLSGKRKGSQDTNESLYSRR